MTTTTTNLQTTSTTTSITSASSIKSDSKAINQLQLINSMVQFFWPKYSWIEKRVLELCNAQSKEFLVNNPYIEDLQIHYIRIGNHPIQFLSCRTQQIHSNQFILNLDFVYKHFEMQYTLKPKIIPWHLNFLLKDFEIQGTCKLIFEFNDEFCLSFSLQDYPTMHWNLQLFQNLQIDTQGNSFFLDYLKKKIQSIVMDYLVFPKRVQLFTLSQLSKSNINSGSSSSSSNEKSHIPWHHIRELLQLQSDVPLEDEVQTILNHIRSFLTNTEYGSEQEEETIRRDIVQHLLLFLKKSLEPNKLPLSMMQTVKIAIQIINNLIFVHGELVDKELLMLLLESWNWETIGQIARVSVDADELIYNIMLVNRDEQVKKKVNQICQELNMQDVPFSVKSRFRK